MVLQAFLSLPFCEEVPASLPLPFHEEVPVFLLTDPFSLHEALDVHVRVHAHVVTADARASFREEVPDAHAHVYIREALAFLLPP